MTRQPQKGSPVACSAMHCRSGGIGRAPPSGNRVANKADCRRRASEPALPILSTVTCQLFEDEFELEFEEPFDELFEDEFELEFEELLDELFEELLDELFEELFELELPATRRRSSVFCASTFAGVERSITASPRCA
ncbi:MAG: hypothetical protein ACRCWF_15740 [Beijerinckiaceae bacterium]